MEKDDNSNDNGNNGNNGKAQVDFATILATLSATGIGSLATPSTPAADQGGPCRDFIKKCFFVKNTFKEQSLRLLAFETFVQSDEKT